MVCFLFVTLVIMLNILIAQLIDTYQNVQADAQRGLEVNRAWNVARVELNSWFHGQVKISCILKIQQDMRFSRLTNSCTDVN